MSCRPCSGTASNNVPVSPSDEASAAAHSWPQGHSTLEMLGAVVSAQTLVPGSPPCTQLPTPAEEAGRGGLMTGTSAP